MFGRSDSHSDSLSSLKTFIEMCDFKLITYTCGHYEHRLASHCHFARNDPNHQCFGVSTCKKTYPQVIKCYRCTLEDEQKAAAGI